MTKQNNSQQGIRFLVIAEARDHHRGSGSAYSWTQMTVAI
jgi:hypothetical protein